MNLSYAAPIYVNIEYITGSHGSKTTQMKVFQLTSFMSWKIQEFEQI